MKKTWVKPIAKIEHFAANECIAACYNVECNVRGDIYVDSNKNGKLDRKDKLLGYNYPCGETFDINSKDLQDGFLYTGEKIKVADYEDNAHGVRLINPTSNHS